MSEAAEAPEPIDWNAVVASNVRAEMGRAGIRQAQLATQLGVGEMWLSRRIGDGGTTTITPSEIKLFADHFGVSVDELFMVRPSRAPGGGTKFWHGEHTIGGEPATTGTGSRRSIH